MNIKRFLLFPLRTHRLWPSRAVRRISLSFGSAICCPSVTYVRPHWPETLFAAGYRSDIDWQAWERISRLKGDFVYCNTFTAFFSF